MWPDKVGVASLFLTPKSLLLINCPSKRPKRVHAPSRVWTGVHQVWTGERCRTETENPNKAAGNWPWAAVLSQIALQHLKAGIIRLACSTWPHSGNHGTQPGLYVSVISAYQWASSWRSHNWTLGAQPRGVAKGRRGALPRVLLTPALQRSSSLYRERRRSEN